MKKILLLPILLIFGCGTPEKTQKEINDEYIQKAQNYYIEKVKELNKNSVDQIDSVVVQRLDSLVPISTYALEDFKMTPVAQEFSRQSEYVSKLIDIEKSFGVPHSSQTLYEIDKLKKLLDSIENWKVLSQKFDKKDTISFKAIFSGYYVKKDGSKLKNQPIFLAFDKDGDIDGKIMELIFR